MADLGRAIYNTGGTVLLNSFLWLMYHPPRALSRCIAYALKVTSTPLSVMIKILGDCMKP